MIRPVIDYANVVWTSCDKHCLNRVQKLQKRAARIILDADYQASSVKLFNKLNWIPFLEQAKLTKCRITYNAFKYISRMNHASKNMSHWLFSMKDFSVFLSEINYE